MVNERRYFLKLVEVQEGDTCCLVPKFENVLGPKTSKKEVFYNPAMELNRDITIAFLKSNSCKNSKILDGMAATGIRGFRIANETKCNEITINDVDQKAFEVINKNMSTYDFKDTNIKATNRAVEIHIMENRFEYDYIDIDPFGTPVPYFSTAVRYVSNGGVIAVTATDTALLCGTYPKACFRRYSAWPKNNWCRHENGLRILIGYCAREAARFDRAITPLLSYYEGHHFRSYLRIQEGAKRANSILKRLRTYDFDQLGWSEEGNYGPFWDEKLFSKKIIKKLKPVGKLDKELIETWKKEAGFPPFFYDTNIIGKYFKRPPPSISEVIQELKKEGYDATRTHFSHTGIKTNAPKVEIKKIYQY